MLKLNFWVPPWGCPHQTAQRNGVRRAWYVQNRPLKTLRGYWLIAAESTQHQLLKTLLIYGAAVIAITHFAWWPLLWVVWLTLAGMAMNGRKTPLTLIAHKPLRPMLEVVKLACNYPAQCKFCHSFCVSPKPSWRQILPSLYAATPISLAAHVTIEVIALSHRMPSHAFKITKLLIIRI